MAPPQVTLHYPSKPGNSGSGQQMLAVVAAFILLSAAVQCLFGIGCVQWHSHASGQQSIKLSGATTDWLSGATSGHKQSKDSSSVYNVFSATWAQAGWSRWCAAPGGHQLCQLPKIWRDCTQGIYLDVGTNKGVQLRKLYDPQQFPEAEVLPVFNEVFGSNRSGVCSIGIEANPHHTQYLSTVNNYFGRKRLPGIIVTEVAAAVRSGSATFHLDTGSPVEWGASLSKGRWQKNTNHTEAAEVTVPLFPLPAFVVEVVKPIMLEIQQATGRLPPVVMKLDVEGAEYSLLPGLMLTGALCDISLLFLEVHHRNLRSDEGVNKTVPEMQDMFASMRKAHPGCRVKITDLDDETYLHAHQIPLPS